MVERKLSINGKSENNLTASRHLKRFHWFPHWPPVSTTRTLLCAAGSHAQKAIHNYAFTCLFASSFAHLFIHLFICYWLRFDPAVISFITDELWVVLHVYACFCTHACVLRIKVAGVQKGHRSVNRSPRVNNLLWLCNIFCHWLSSNT